MAVPLEAFGQWKKIEIYHPYPLQRVREKTRGDWRIQCRIRGASNIQQAKLIRAMASVVASRRCEMYAATGPRSVADFRGVGEVVNSDAEEELYGTLLSTI